MKTREKILIIVLLLLLLAIAAEIFGQTVTFTPIPHGNKLQLDLSYSGDSFAIGGIGCRVWYDTSSYSLDSITPRHKYAKTGVFSATTSSVIADRFGIMWWASDFYDTVWTNNYPIATVYLTAKGGCSYFSFQGGWCDLADIDVNPVYATWVNAYSCYTWGKRKVMPEKVYDLMGRPTEPKGLHIINRKLYYR